LFLPHFVDRITPGNLEDHFRWLSEADWIIEVVIEDLAVKREIMARIDGIAPNVIASMQRDIMEGRPSELEAQNGAVVRMGRALGIPTPTHEKIYEALLPLEKRRGDQPRRARNGKSKQKTSYLVSFVFEI
jgi:hypothetical protein